MSSQQLESFLETSSKCMAKTAADSKNPEFAKWAERLEKEPEKEQMALTEESISCAEKVLKIK